MGWLDRHRKLGTETGKLSLLINSNTLLQNSEFLFISFVFGNVKKFHIFGRCLSVVLRSEILVLKTRCLDWHLEGCTFNINLELAQALSMICSNEINIILRRKKYVSIGEISTESSCVQQLTLCGKVWFGKNNSLILGPFLVWCSYVLTLKIFHFGI